MKSLKFESSEVYEVVFVVKRERKRKQLWKQNLKRIQDIHWYPGHMTKAKRMIIDSLKDIDVVVELLDARIPFASKNPDIEYLTKNKPKLLILNKYDLASSRETERWAEYYRSKGCFVIWQNSLKADTGAFISAVRALLTRPKNTLNAELRIRR